MGLIPFLKNNGNTELFDIPENELIENCRKGNHAAFECIYRKYSGLVFSIAFHVLKDHHVSSEVTQDVFIKVYQKLDGFRENSSFKAWISKIALNSTLGILRKKNETVPIENIEKASSDNVIPDRALEFNELNGRLDKAVSEMTDELKEVFSLAVLGRTSYKEIADMLNISIESVKVRVFRARKFLKERLGKYMEEG